MCVGVALSHSIYQLDTHQMTESCVLDGVIFRIANDGMFIAMGLVISEMIRSPYIHKKKTPRALQSLHRHELEQCLSTISSPLSPDILDRTKSTITANRPRRIGKISQYLGHVLFKPSQRKGEARSSGSQKYTTLVS